MGPFAGRQAIDGLKELTASRKRGCIVTDRNDDAVSTLKRAAQLDAKLGEAEKINDVIKQLGG